MQRTRQEIWCTRLLCQTIHSLCPDALFSNVFLHVDVPSGLHVDSHNHAQIDNTLIPLSIWRGRGLWCWDIQGTHQLSQNGPTGVIRDLVMPYIRFNSRLPHAVMPWEGERFVLGTYHIRDDWLLASQDGVFLQEQGFRLCTYDQATADPYQEH